MHIKKYHVVGWEKHSIRGYMEKCADFIPESSLLFINLFSALYTNLIICLLYNHHILKVTTEVTAPSVSIVDTCRETIDRCCGWSFMSLKPIHYMMTKYLSNEEGDSGMTIIDAFRIASYSEQILSLIQFQTSIPWNNEPAPFGFNKWNFGMAQQLYGWNHQHHLPQVE